MAITVEQSPPLFCPVYNEAVFVLSSTNSGNENFNLRATIKDSDGDTLALVKVPPRPDDYLVVDIGRIIESEVSFDFAKLLNQTTGIQQCSVYERYTVEFQEEFGSTPAATGSITTASGYVYNAALRSEEFSTYSQADWLLSGSSSKFLTNCPRSLNIREGESAELGMMLSGAALGYISIKTYDHAGSLIQEATLVNGHSLDDAGKFLTLLCGTDDLNNTAFDTGSQPIITEWIKSYAVQARSGTSAGVNAAISETVTFTVDRDCTRYEAIRLHFLNRMGRFDSFTFKMVHRQTVKKQAKEYKRFTGELSGSSWVNNQSARGNVVFDTLNTREYEVNSDWITEDESEWLQELFDSPVVYWQQEPGTPNSTFAVNIKDTDYEVKQRVNDRLFNYNIRFMLSIQDIRQRA